MAFPMVEPEGASEVNYTKNYLMGTVKELFALSFTKDIVIFSAKLVNASFLV